MKTKNVKIIFTVIVFGVVLLWVIYTEYKLYLLKKNFSVTTGQVIGITKETYKNNSKSILYSYEVNGKKYTGENGISSCRELSADELRILLTNHFYSVAYEKDDIENSSIIVTSKEAEIYNCKLTDEQKQIDSVLSCR
jgi:hypothetical protein